MVQVICRLIIQQAAGLANAEAHGLSFSNVFLAESLAFFITKLGQKLIQEMKEDWKGMMIEVLAMIAGGRREMKVMRMVCKSWQAGFESSVTKLRQGPGV